MATTFGERLQEIINKTAGNTNKFGQMLGLKNPQKLYYLIKGETAPSYDLLEQITNIFVDISPEWLLTGKGSMLRDAQATTTPSLPANPSSLRVNPAISPCPELVAQIAELQSKIELLESHNKELKAHIEDLRSSNQYFQKILDKATVVEAIKEDISLKKSKVNA